MVSKAKIAIIGGGIAGLACAHRLTQLRKEKSADFEFVILESSSRLGGTIETEKRDGFLLEKGPDSFLSEKPWGLELSKRLGIDGEIIGTRSEHRKSFIARKNSLIPLPEGFYLIAPAKFSTFFESPLFSPIGKLRIASELFIPKWQSEQEESVGAFIRRRFGKEALTKVGQAMLAGIYTGDPDLLSVSATMPRFKEFEMKHGSVIRALLHSARGKRNHDVRSASGPRYSLFLSFKDGLETLVKAIQEKLLPSEIHLNFDARSVSFDNLQEKWKIQAASGKVISADVVCMAVPAHKAGKLLGNEAPLLSSNLNQIRHESVATINFAFRRSDISHPLDGFGFVVLQIENRSLVACSFSSVKFDFRASEGNVLLRAFVGGAFGRKYLEMDNMDLIGAVLKDLTELLDIRGKPIFFTIHRHPNSMVQYQIGHLKLVSDIEQNLEKIKGLFLTGSAYRGVGIPDCIHDAEVQAEQIFEKFCNFPQHAEVP